MLAPPSSSFERSCDQAAAGAPLKLYEKYKDRVQFVVVDMDRQRSGAQTIW